MFWVAAAFSAVFAGLFGSRCGDLWRHQSWPERVGYLCVTGTLIALFVGLFTRAVNDDPFLWIHWLISVFVVAGVFAYGYLLWRARRDVRRRHLVLNKASDEIAGWLSEVEQFDPCDNPDCQRIRSEMRVLGQELRRP